MTHKLHTMKPLFRALQQLQEKDSKFPINAALTLMYVGQHEPCLKRDMEITLGFNTACGSRNTDYLSKINRLRQPGLNLINKVEDPDDRRQTILTLTPEGKEFYTLLTNAYVLDRSG